MMPFTDMMITEYRAEVSRYKRLIERAAELLRSGREVGELVEGEWAKERDQWLRDAGLEGK
jgi:hypothetical protein